LFDVNVVFVFRDSRENNTIFISYKNRPAYRGRAQLKFKI